MDCTARQGFSQTYRERELHRQTVTKEYLEKKEENEKGGK
jgi:hypothetical protein